MLSRVAENLYWMSRYVERAENVARLLDIVFDVELDDAGIAGEAERSPTVAVLHILGCADAYRRRHGTETPDRASVLRFLTFDRRNRVSIRSMIGAARENARGSQEAVSAEVWGQINRLYLDLGGARARWRFQTSPSRFYDRLKRECILFAGLIDGTLPRDEAYHFLQAGRHLERTVQIGGILRSRAHLLLPETEQGDQTLQLVHATALLRTCSAHDAYLRTYRDQIDPDCVVQYLVLDPDFPRSIRSGVCGCLASLREISGVDHDEYGSEAERLLGRLDSELRYLETSEIFAMGLPRFLDKVLTTCTQVGNEIHQAYFFT